MLSEKVEYPPLESREDDEDIVSNVPVLRFGAGGVAGGVDGS